MFNNFKKVICYLFSLSIIIVSIFSIVFLPILDISIRLKIFYYLCFCILLYTQTKAILTISLVYIQGYNKNLKNLSDMFLSCYLVIISFFLLASEVIAINIERFNIFSEISYRIKVCNLRVFRKTKNIFKTIKRSRI